MLKPKVQVKYEPITRRLHMIKRNGDSLQGPLSEMGEIILSSVEENFQQQGRFATAGSWEGGSSRWKDLAPATKEARKKKGKWPGMILQQSQGGLASSFSYQVTGDNLVVGSNKKYAAIHQFGGQAGRGRKVKISARPFLVVQDDDIEDMMDVLGKHLMKG